MSNIIPKRTPDPAQNRAEAPCIEHTMLKVEIMKWCDEGEGHWYPDQVHLVFREGAWHRKISHGEWVNTGREMSELPSVMETVRMLRKAAGARGKNPAKAGETILCLLKGEFGGEDFYKPGEAVCKDGDSLKCNADGTWTNQGPCPERRAPDLARPTSARV